MESRNTKRSWRSKRKHTEKLCLVLSVLDTQEVSTLKTEYNLAKNRDNRKNRLKERPREKTLKKRLEIGQVEKGAW